MWWMEFMRTGNRDYYLTAQSNSAHAMDVDNTHWPAPKKYLGETNNSVDFFDNKEKALRYFMLSFIECIHYLSKHRVMMEHHTYEDFEKNNTLADLIEHYKKQRLVDDMRVI